MRRFVFEATFGSLAFVAAAVAALDYIERPTVLRVAVPRDSEDQAILAAAMRSFAESRETVRLKLVTVENLVHGARSRRRPCRSSDRAQRSGDAGARPNLVDHAAQCRFLRGAAPERAEWDRRTSRAKGRRA
jgi:hypothetical protein